jgi:hypothetical protein
MESQGTHTQLPLYVEYAEKKLTLKTLLAFLASGVWATAPPILAITRLMMDFQCILLVWVS